MLIQLHLSPTDARAAKAYRLQVKERLYRFNYVSADNFYLLCAGLTGSLYTGSTCSARREGPLREARRDVSERLGRLSENIGDVAVMWVSSGGQHGRSRQPLRDLHVRLMDTRSRIVICGYARCPGRSHYLLLQSNRLWKAHMAVVISTRWLTDPSTDL
jgi:hypothetical protein